VTRKELEQLLRDFKAERLTINEALDEIGGDYAYEDLGYAKVDYDRERRQGVPEVVYCAGKTPEQVKGILKKLAEHTAKNLLATRASREIFDAVKEELATAQYHETARLIAVTRGLQERIGRVLVVSAGTSDLPVAEEAALTAEFLGNRVERLYDAGVAGIHRLLDNREQLVSARVLIVVAGMEGALPSVVGGLVDKPVIAVPTSVGYGASFGGLAALLGMLNSCASGVAVVNIDNGFGAGYLASQINHLGVRA